MKTLVVIPTYNEIENLPLMLEALFSLKEDLDVLIVDDNSPDKTGELAEKLKSQYHKLHVLHRKEKEGLGKAYLDAFKYAASNYQFEYLIQMDIDFSHNPDDIPRLIKGLENADCVIGSRHVKGSELLYPWYRKLLSAAANLYAKTILNLPVKDCTAGFRAMKKEVVAKIINERFYSRDYAFQNEILFYVKKYGFQIKEIPVVFKDRKYGVSKMKLSNVLFGAIGVFKIRLRNIIITRPYLNQKIQKVRKVITK